MNLGTAIRTKTHRTRTIVIDIDNGAGTERHVGVLRAPSDAFVEELQKLREDGRISDRQANARLAVEMLHTPKWAGDFDEAQYLERLDDRHAWEESEEADKGEVPPMPPEPKDGEPALYEPGDTVGRNASIKELSNMPEGSPFHLVVAECEAFRMDLQRDSLQKKFEAQKRLLAIADTGDIESLRRRAGQKKR